MKTLQQLNTDRGGVFGQFQQFAENLTALGTTSAVFATFLTLTSPVVEAGTYRLGVVFQYSASNGSTVGEYKLELDNATTLELQTLAVASAGEEKTYANIGQTAILAGAHTIDIEIRRSAGSGTFTIDDAKLEVWRVA